jgi:hypothetical protein
VVHALRLLHASLAEQGVLIDTQPVGAEPSVWGSGERLGSLYLHKWAEMVAAVDERVEEALAAGFFRVEHEEDFLACDEFGDAEDLLETASGWRGTEVPEGLAERVRAAAPPFRVEQQVRIRLFRRL